MITQEDIISRYAAAIAMSTSITHRDMGAVDLALRLAVQDAAQVKQPVVYTGSDFEGELLAIYQWIEAHAPWASKPDTTIADDAIALMSKQCADIETLQNAFNAEAFVLRSSITEQDSQIHSLRQEVNRLQVFVQTNENHEHV